MSNSIAVIPPKNPALSLSRCNMARFDVYAHGHYLCTINQTLRVMKSAFDCERCMNAMQTLIDQHPVGLLIMPVGEHKKSSAVSLADIAPKLVRVCRRKNTKKRPSNSNGRGSRFSKKRSPENKDLQTQKTPFFEKSRSVK